MWRPVILHIMLKVNLQCHADENFSSLCHVSLFFPSVSGQIPCKWQASELFDITFVSLFYPPWEIVFGVLHIANSLTSIVLGSICHTRSFTLRFLCRQFLCEGQRRCLIRCCSQRLCQAHRKSSEWGVRAGHTLKWQSLASAGGKKYQSEEVLATVSCSDIQHRGPISPTEWDREIVKLLFRWDKCKH